jgi:hypothetical protein
LALVQNLGQLLVDDVTFDRPVIFESRFGLKIIFKVRNVRRLNLEIIRNLSDLFAEKPVADRKVLNLEVKV